MIKVEPKELENLDEKNRIPKKFKLIVLSLILGLILIGAIIALAITGSNPCSFTKCHEKATCVNHAFYGECVCNYGYNGNGREHCDECGVTNFDNNANERGVSAVSHSWPATGIFEFTYTTLAHLDSESILLYEYDNCGAVLINRQTALTAAHCIKRSFNYYDYYYRKNFTIDVETNNFHPNLESIYTLYFGTNTFVYYGVELAQVKLADFTDIIIHPDYNPDTLENDIAIIKLAKPIELDTYIQITCLPNATSSQVPDLEKKFAFIAGYSSSGGSFSSWTLMNTRIDLYNNSMCDRVQSDKTKNWNSQFCAGEYNDFGNTTGSCHGDYGSSLYTKETVNGKEKFITTGLLSYDVPCRVNHSPAVYTRVAYYMDWIKKNSKY